MLKMLGIKRNIGKFFLFSLQTFFSNVGKYTKATFKIHDEIRERLNFSRLLGCHCAKYVSKEKKYI